MSYDTASTTPYFMSFVAIDMSHIKALQKLETIYSVKLTDEKAGISTMKIVPLTKEQEKIYEALDVIKLGVISDIRKR
jgi:hypothetical protein